MNLRVSDIVFVPQIYVNSSIEVTEPIQMNFFLKGRFIEINKTLYRIVEKKKTRENTRRQIIEKKTKIHGSCNIVLFVIELIKKFSLSSIITEIIKTIYIS